MQFVCVNCFADGELKGFILSQQTRGLCDCCQEKEVEIVAIEELIGFFKELFENFEVHEEGSSLLYLIQSNWNFFKDFERGHKIITQVLAKMNSPLNNPEALVNFSTEILDNVQYWFQLKEDLKWKNRYLTDINYLTDDLGWDGFFESKTMVQSDSIFYRARLHAKAGEDRFSEKEMVCPPRELSSGGRANPMGIPYLYLSDNEETLLYEIRASYLDEVSIAAFIVNEEQSASLIISDFTETSTLFHPGFVNKKIKSTLLKQLISSDLSKPMRRYDSELDYLPTQFICEFIRIFTNVQGIKFKSSLHEDGMNLVIFDERLMKCMSSKKVKVTDVSIKSLDL